MIGEAAAKTFSEADGRKIEDAIGIHKDRLNKAFEQRVNEEVRRRMTGADDTLREGRIHCGGNDRAFGTWLKQTGRDYISKDDRAALIGLAKNLTVARDLLSKTSSRSHQHI